MNLNKPQTKIKIMKSLQSQYFIVFKYTFLMCLLNKGIIVEVLPRRVKYTKEKSF